VSPAQDLIYWELLIRRPWWMPWRTVVECPFCALRWTLPASRSVSVAQAVKAGMHTCEAHAAALQQVLWVRSGGTRGRPWRGKVNA
jgi:hypothetical protein